jgi:DNA-binding HxlR family transcriptional regulator
MRFILSSALYSWAVNARLRGMVKAKLDPGTASPQAHACSVPSRLASAFGLLQEKWALSIVYVLLRGPNGFNDVGRGAGSVNSATLVRRLSRLEQAGLVRKTVRSTMPPRTTYELTKSGRALEPVITALARWSERYGGEDLNSED